jgi:hypothetical protein
MSTRGISPRLHPAPGLRRFSPLFHGFCARTQFFFDTLCNSCSMGDPRKMRRGHPRTQVRSQFLTFLFDPRCDSCLRFLAGRCAAAPGFRATCIRRAESSGGLLATSFGGLHPFTRLSTHPLGLPFLFFRDFLFFLRTFHVRCSRTHPPFWERTSACVIHLCSVFARPPPFFLLHFHSFLRISLFSSYVYPYVLSIWRVVL